MQLRRPISHWLIMLPFVAAGLNAASEVVEDATRGDRNLQLLAVLQCIFAVASAIVVTGLWRRAVWTTRAIAVWGLIGGAMILALGPLLGLSDSERRGMPTAAGIVVAIAAVCALLTRRYVSMDSARARGRTAE